MSLTDEAKASLRMYINDMIAVERDLANAMAGQLETDEVKARPEVQKLLTAVVMDSAARSERLRDMSAQLHGETGAAVKEAIASVAGTLAGFYGSLRKHPLSRMLRDDHVALNLAAVAYGMLHAAALTYHEPVIAAMALAHLDMLPPSILALGRLIPEAVVQELSAEQSPAASQASLIETARSNIERAWTRAEIG